jgi:hypothetical protein
VITGRTYKKPPPANDVKFGVSQFADDPDMAELVTEYVGAFSDSATRIKQAFEERCLPT